MNFFEHQAVARRNTGRLIFLFLLAVVSMIAVIYVVVSAGLLYGQKTPSMEIQWWDPDVFIAVSLGTIFVVTIGTVYKIITLKSGGGRAVAESLGATPVSSSTKNKKYRQLINVVEEMSIASGMPVPSIYVMEHESGINAFAAGWRPSDAVVSVTEGCLNTLNRDELQGVIAHEFSHILHGDMRLNLRLIGILHGILLLGLIGRMMLYSSGRSSMYRSRSNNKNSGGILAMALALFIIGYVGFFFGKLIKSAVSRQREFLADASAVQFTRNPDGIAGALKKIGGLSFGGELETSKAEESSHLFFSNALASSWFSMMASHPPLDERIRRIEPTFNGKFAQTLSSNGDNLYSGLAAQQMVQNETPTHIEVAPESVVEQVGQLNAEQVQWASDLRASFGEIILEASKEPFGARALVYGLLLDDNKVIQEKQLNLLHSHADTKVVEELLKLQPGINDLMPDSYIPLIEISMPALRQLSHPQFEVFRDNIKRLIYVDNSVSLFEFTLQYMVVKHLQQNFHPASSPAFYQTLKALHYDVRCLLSAIAYIGSSEEVISQQAFVNAVEYIEFNRVVEMLPVERCGFEELDESLIRLNTLRMNEKKLFLQAAVACVQHDGKVTLGEGELIRAFADALDCPMPPLGVRRT